MDTFFKKLSGRIEKTWLRPPVDHLLVDRPIVDRLLVDRPLVDRPLVDRPLVDRPLIDVLDLCRKFRSQGFLVLKS